MTDLQPVPVALSASPVWMRSSSHPVRIALVNMPFAAADTPSIQCGLLKAVLRGTGHHVDVHYLNLKLATRLGEPFYARLAGPRRNNQLLGEWLFSKAVFDDLPDPEEYLAGVPDVAESCGDLGLSFDELCRLRTETLPDFLDDCAREVDWAAYQIVGFTSTFEQHLAVLGLARRIKELAPQTTIVVGGSNVDDEMGPENIRAFPWLDFVVVGEGEAPLCQLAERIGAGHSPLGVPGVIGRRDGEVVDAGRGTSVTHMDGLPDPDYSDYFASLAKAEAPVLPEGRLPSLLLETSRGCWWGQKHHCTFCGLNNNGMTYRSKSPERVLAELGRASKRYALLSFAAVDNIMDPRYLRGLWDQLAADRLDYHFFYEIKASLSREQLQTMARAGVGAIQPGIESLSTRILGLMRKGTTLLDNVRILKWARHYGMDTGWNLLTGFPGERAEDYAHQLAVVPLISHLQPPYAMGRVWLERFSPYFFDPSFPVRDRRPEPAYGYIYPAGQVDLEKIAYFFAYEMDDVAEVPQNLIDAVTDWKASWQDRSLGYHRAPDWLRILDRRDPSRPTVITLHGAEAQAYEACGDWQRTAEHVAKRLSEQGCPKVSTAEAQSMLDGFCRAGLMLGEEGRYISLALPARRL
ncbi:RiPP maturation radical SAM C-methyltransferase [Streptomyces virginiae]|uniref:RiPP maturation radical SAM C-methyltransferase n=1 Tax=Streptomyces virginiae TaxID=1961 RepID=UPI0036C46228